MNTTSADKTVLVIEDDEVFAGVLARALERRGYQVSVAHRVPQAQTMAQQIRPRYAVLDMNLDGENGMQLIGALRQAVGDCRIVVLTGYASIATAVKAIKLGASEYLAKPVDTNAVLRALQDVEDDSAVDDEAPDVPLSVDQVEWEHIQRVLGEHSGNITATARALNMHRRTLQRKLAKHAPRRRPIAGS